MKKTVGLLLGLILITGSILPVETDASVGVISVVTNKSSKEITAYVKNNHNKDKNVVVLEFQKNGKTIEKRKVTLNKNQQIKQSFKMVHKGKYRIKYTFKGKYSYTSTYSK